MVKWRNREGSRNVEDRRGAAAGLSGLAILLIRFVFSRFGIGGIIVLVGGFFALRAVGVDPLALLAGQPAMQAQQTEADDDAFQFSSVILAETEKVWSEVFAEAGAQYTPTTLVIYTGGEPTGCGYGSSAAGPFYCPADQKVYLDTSFFTELSQRFGAPGDFAAAYVIAHEVGHHRHVQSGASSAVTGEQGGTKPASGNDGIAG